MVWLVVTVVVLIAAYLAWRNFAIASGAPAVGGEAPDFALPDQHGRTRSLAELRGKPIVLYFFPRADTPG